MKQPGIIDVNGLTMHFAAVEGATFFMGSNLSRDDDWPMVRVRIDPFRISIHPVRQDLFEQVMGWNHSHFKGMDLPVTNVSHAEATEFCMKLSERKPHARFRLPREAEWEWAARANRAQRYSGSNNLQDCGWYDANSSMQLQPVCSKQPNAFGLYDMSGNVWEWCEDVYRNKYASRPWPFTPTLHNPKGKEEGNNRCVRGGCFLFHERACRTRTRSRRISPGRCAFVGFRVVMEY